MSKTNSVLIPTTLGAALYKAAQHMKTGANTPLAREIRHAVETKGKQYSVPLSGK